MKNWKTSLIGLAFAVGNAVATHLFQAPDGKIDRGALFSSVGLLVLGFFAKDHDVTGGSRVQEEND